jgi:phosphoribosyl 1,2-cyclic phosphodiesterase
VLRFKNLGSGSSGNATLVQASGIRTTRLLVDCGMGLKQLSSRLAQARLDEQALDAIFITHEHSDHIGCARQFALQHRVPVWMSRGTYEAVGSPDFDGLLKLSADGQTIDLGELQITPFTVPHDAREPLQLTCSDGQFKLGVLTDLGHATAHVLAHLAGCHALLLECNHDPDLLAKSTVQPSSGRHCKGHSSPRSGQGSGRTPERTKQPAGTGLVSTDSCGCTFVGRP